MAQIQLVDLVATVRTILADPQAALRATGQTTLDYALAEFAHHCRAGLPLKHLNADFWSPSRAPSPLPRD